MIKNRKCQFVILLAILQFAAPSRASLVHVAIGIIPGLIEEHPSHTNEYNLFLDQLSQVKLDFVPIPRANRLFSLKMVDCVFPGSIRNMPSPENYIQSTPLKTIHAYLFYPSKSAVPKSLTNVNIGIRRGLEFGYIRQKIAANFIELNSDELVLKMLNKGRVSAIVAYLPDLQAALSHTGLRKLPYYDEANPIYESEDALLCHNSPSNNKLVAQANQTLDQRSPTKHEP